MCPGDEPIILHVCLFKLLQNIVVCAHCYSKQQLLPPPTYTTTHTRGPAHARYTDTPTGKSNSGSNVALHELASKVNADEISLADALEKSSMSLMKRGSEVRRDSMIGPARCALIETARLVPGHAGPLACSSMCQIKS